MGVLTLISSSMSLPSDRVRGLSARIPNSCSTRTGDSCVFPFTYQGVEHYHCTYADSPTSWCATMTDSQGVVVTNRWGDCETSSLSSCQEEQISLPSCTTQSGPYPSQPCVFPFRYNGVTYTSCTEWIYGGENQGSKWCSTKVDSQGVHVNGEGNYGFCGADCNIDTVSLAEILESLIGANARTASQKNKDSVVFGNRSSKIKLPK